MEQFITETVEFSIADYSTAASNLQKTKEFRVNYQEYYTDLSKNVSKMCKYREIVLGEQACINSEHVMPSPIVQI